VRIDVVDINDHAPQFVFDANTSRYAAEINENSPAVIVLQLAATDEDSTTNGEIAFRISGGE
jgi:protocadherin-15